MKYRMIEFGHSRPWTWLPELHRHPADAYGRLQLRVYWLWWYVTVERKAKLETPKL